MNIQKAMYHIGFEMVIQGCKLNFVLEDKEILKSVSREHIDVNKMEFKENKKGNGSILYGSIYAAVPEKDSIPFYSHNCWHGYNYILFELNVYA